MTIRMRPRFTLSVSLSKEEVMERFRDQRQAGNICCQVQLLDVQVEFAPFQKDQHIWSPYLKLLVDQEPDGSSTLRGSFGPNANLWTLFMGAYAVCFVTGSMALLGAFSQWQLGQSLSALFVVALCLIGAVLVWLAGQLGQRLAQDQMVAIHQCVHAVLGESVLSEDSR